METEQTQNDNVPTVVETPVIVKKKDNTARFVYGVFVAFAILFVFGIFFGRIVYFPIIVKGLSMQPTLNAQSLTEDDHQDTVYLGSARHIKHGDIVVFDSRRQDAAGNTQYYIKRVIAMPADTISFQVTGQDNDYIFYQVVLNGEPLDEPYLKEPMRIKKFNPPDDDQFFFETFVLTQKTITLGDDQFFLMGDNRNDSADSRYLGPIARQDFLGKVVLHIEHGKTLFEALIQKIF